MHEGELADVSDLVRRGILQFSSEAPVNPRHLDYPGYTVPLIAHDYPARTPAMWNAAYRAFGMDIANIIMTGDPDQAPAILHALRRDPRYLGGGAGVGFKEKAFALVDELDALATAAGAVNLVSKAGAVMRGHNTDGIGFAAGLQNLLRSRDDTIDGKTVLMLGAGGTARAVATVLAGRGARLRIVNRTVSRAKSLAARLNANSPQPVATGGGEEEIDRGALAADIIVNASTKGSAGPLSGCSALAPAGPQNLKISGELMDRLPRTTILCDVVIAQGGTPFLRQATERGFTVLDGITMVVHQAVEAFRILHGSELQLRGFSEADVRDVMHAAARAV